MKFSLNQILPAEVSDETAFQLVNFTRSLALALESMYFDQMLHHSSDYEHSACTRTQEEDENDVPF